MRILLAEEGLRTLDGHWFQYLHSIHDGLRRQGHEVVVAAHRDVVPAVAERLPIRRVYRFSRWDGIYEKLPKTRRQMMNLWHNVRLTRDLAAFFPTEAPFDGVFTSNVTVSHAWGWRWLTGRFGGKAFRRLVMMFVQDAGYYVNGRSEPIFPRHSLPLRRALKSYGPYLRRGLVQFAAETRRTAEQYERFCGHPLTLYPHAIESPAELPERSLAAEGTVTLASFGFARYEKGSDLLQRAILAVRRKAPAAKLRFLVQWRTDFTLPDGARETKHPELLRDPGVEFVDASLDPVAYERYLAAVDGVVLPYRRSSYFSRLSRVTLDALTHGLPIVYTRDTWLEDVTTEFGAGIGFDNENPEDLARALLEMAAAIGPLRSQARARAPQARDAFSADRFARILTSDSGKAPVA